MNRIIVTNSVNPYHNLALEEVLFERQGAGATLYLWQNEHTIVIGRNQNAWRECRVELLESEGGFLARRSSGGGAVFHDLGNLNFSFLLPREDYDLVRQLSVVQKAAAAFGIETCFTGRNDLVLTSTGEKFSGNAFRFSQGIALHHGTILIGADMEKLSRYLAPSRFKLEAKGVKSVASRVTNLSLHNPLLTIERMKDALLAAFADEYGEAQPLNENEVDAGKLERAREKYASWEWRFGATPAFNVSFENRFSFGCLELLLNVQGGAVSGAACYTDAMDASLSARIESALCGCTYGKTPLCIRLQESGGAEEKELAAWLNEQAF